MPIDAAALIESIQALQKTSDEDSDVSRAVDEIIDAAAQLFHACGTGLMMIDGAQVLRYVSASNPASRILETAQEEAGEGPCVEALVEDRLVQSTDLRVDDRWPRLTPLIDKHPIRAVLGIPVHVGGAAMGSLNAYVDEPYSWDETEVVAIERYSRLLENLLGAAVVAQRHSTIVDQLQYALDNRVVIERAVGLLMGREGIGASDAYERLRQTSRRSRRRVAELAAALLEGEDLGAIDNDHHR